MRECQPRATKTKSNLRGKFKSIKLIVDEEKVRYFTNPIITLILIES
jgi:hypothetical protein